MENKIQHFFNAWYEVCVQQTKVVVKYGRWTYQIGALGKGIRLATVNALKN